MKILLKCGIGTMMKRRKMSRKKSMELWSLTLSFFQFTYIQPLHSEAKSPCNRMGLTMCASGQQLVYYVAWLLRQVAEGIFNEFILRALNCNVWSLNTLTTPRWRGHIEGIAWRKPETTRRLTIFIPSIRSSVFP